MIGRAWYLAIFSQTDRVKVFGIVHTPISAVGCSRSTACSSVEHSSISCAYKSLWCCSESFREATTRPLESTSQICWRASCTDFPVSRAMAWANKSAIPVPASPAPRNRKLWCCSGIPVTGIAARMPPSTTDAVPCTHSSQMLVEILQNFSPEYRHWTCNAYSDISEASQKPLYFQNLQTIPSRLIISLPFVEG